MDVLLSIKPEYSVKIVAGVKRIEFRKKIFQQDIDKVYIYSSYPDKKIIGYFNVGAVICAHPVKLWQEYSDIGGISEKDFKNYFENREIGYGVLIRNLTLFNPPLDPSTYKENFKAPQNFMYLDDFIDV